MKIQPRYYPLIIIAVYVALLLLGILLGFGPQRSGGHGNNLMLQIALTLEGLV